MTWAEQVKNGESKSPSLSYVTLKKITSDIASVGPTVKSIYIVEMNCENAS